MDIEEHAEKWADNHLNNPENSAKTIRDKLISAYLAGVQQVRQDYAPMPGDDFEARRAAYVERWADRTASRIE